MSGLECKVFKANFIRKCTSEFSMCISVEDALFSSVWMKGIRKYQGPGWETELVRVLS